MHTAEFASRIHQTLINEFAAAGTGRGSAQRAGLNIVQRAACSRTARVRSACGRRAGGAWTARLAPYRARLSWLRTSRITASEATELLELTDGKILLRHFRLVDAESHLAGEDAEQVRWLSGGRGTLPGVLAWIEGNQRHWQVAGPVFNFAIVHAHTGTLLGMVEANTDYLRIAGLHEGDANISYGLYPCARGHGYASRAVGADGRRADARRGHPLLRST
jgi:hypothetical protein